MKAIYYITMREMCAVVNHWDNDPTDKENRHLYLAQSGGKICAIDNTDGECYAEDFDTFDEAIKWLLELD